MLNRKPVNCNATIKLKEEAKEFRKMTQDDIYIEDYPRELIKKKNPQVKLQLGV